jgi:predicted kinase
MPFIVVSGLPGSGKSTVARELAPRVQLPLLDKDDFLEALFDERGYGDMATRSLLSREADQRFVAAAQAVSGACLVSWWRHVQADPRSGTATAWLAELRAPVIELYCRCRVETALDRFIRRRRHPGHFDAARSADSLRAQFASFAALGPLGCGPIIEVDTEQPPRLDALLVVLEGAIATHTSPFPERPA